MKSFRKKIGTKIEKRYYQYIGAKQIRKHGVWFVDIPRTSSTSIKAELGIIYGLPYGKAKLINRQKWADKLPSDYIAAVKSRSNQMFADHITAIEMQKIVGKKSWKNMFTFTFVRNPWDRLVSLYSTLSKARLIPSEMQFRDYIIALTDAHQKREKSVFRDRECYFAASDYILDGNGKSLVKFIGKYENRSDALKIIAQKIGCEKFGTLDISFSVPRNRHYSEYYDQETQEIVGEIYRKDIELFDYEFES